MNLSFDEPTAITIAILWFQFFLLCFQIIYLLQRPKDRKRFYYLILLLCWFQYNLVSNYYLCPDYGFSKHQQTFLLFVSAIILSTYLPYYLYKSYGIEKLRWFCLPGSIYFIVIPFVLLYFLPYYMTGDILLTRRITVIIPFIFGLTFLLVTTKAFYRQQLLSLTEQPLSGWLSNHFVLLSILSWWSLPLVFIFDGSEGLKQLISNSGLCLLSIAYLQKTIYEAQKEYRDLMELNNSLYEKNLALSKANIRISKNDEVFKSLKNQIYALEYKEREQINDFVCQVKERLEGSVGWEAFYTSFDAANNNFFSRLKVAYPCLTDSELRHLALIKLTTDRKEIANFLDVKQASLRTMRSRLRKKLAIKVTLQEFVDSF